MCNLGLAKLDITILHPFPPICSEMAGCTPSFFVFRRLQLVPLLQELAGGARALDTRLDELSRQSLFAREMLEREALRWEQQHLDGRDGGAGSTSGAGIAGQCEALGPSAETGLPEERGKGAKASPDGVRRDEFPLSAFLKKAGTGSGGEDREQRWRDSDLPELVREELLHRFVMGKLHHSSKVELVSEVLRKFPPDGKAFRAQILAAIMEG